MLVCVFTLFDVGMRDLSLFSRFCIYLRYSLLGVELGSETNDVSVYGDV